MKKIISLTLILLMLMQAVVFASDEEKTFAIAGLDEPYSFTVSGIIGEGQIHEDSPECIIIDKNSCITFNCPIDILAVGSSKDTLIYFNGVNSYETIYGKDNIYECIVDYDKSEREDNTVTFKSYSNETDTVRYMAEGATLRFYEAGLYDLWVVPAMETKEDREAFEINHADKAQKLSETTRYIYVVNDESEYVPYTPDSGDTDYIDIPNETDDDVYEEIIPEEPIFDEPGLEFPDEEIMEYDDTLINIIGISHMEYDRPTVNYHDRVAVCTSPVTIEAKQDIKMFSVTPIIKKDGAYILDDENFISTKEPVYDAKYDAHILPANKDDGFYLTEPGLYNVYAEKDYMDRWTELVIEIVDPNKTYDAAYTDSKVMVDGKEVKFEAYNIADNNYFKLRDIAYVLSGTSKQFEVTWDAAAERVNMLSAMPYTVVGGELANGDGLAKQATNGTNDISLDYAAVNLKAYMINGNNYFKLRDLGKLFNFDVSWDGENNCVLIDSLNSYTED